MSAEPRVRDWSRVAVAAEAQVGGGDGARERLLGLIDRRLEARDEANGRFFDDNAEALARLCHRIAERFARRGRLLALGVTPAARSDARHVAVEFVHPVIVGKRALPALGLCGGSEPLPAQVRLLARPDDIVMAFGLDAGGPQVAEVLEAVGVARALGCLTLGFADGGAPAGPDPASTSTVAGDGADDGRPEWCFGIPAADPFVRQELVETCYHLLWELVHVFFEHRGLLHGRAPRAAHDPGASSFLYPFLGEREHDLAAVLADVAASVRAKADDIAVLRRQTLGEGAPTLLRAARALRARFDAGGRCLALGNGGSATDAMDLVADLRDATRDWPPRPALDLTEDASILTAVANDVGAEAMFSRQVIAHGRRGDALVVFSTSGGSRNVLAALAEARERGLLTVALVGYDGGEILRDELADHVIVSRSQHIPRIQEAHASAYHVLRELIEEVRP